MSFIPPSSLFLFFKRVLVAGGVVRAIRQSNRVAGPSLSPICRMPVKQRKLRDAKLRDRLRNKDDAVKREVSKTEVDTAEGLRDRGILHAEASLLLRLGDADVGVDVEQDCGRRHEQA